MDHTKTPGVNAGAREG